jgi:short-subunit dehydrogenase
MLATNVVLVTGASSGIGYASAELLAKNGFIVYAAARRIEKMNELKKAGVSVIQMDVTDGYQCENCINKIISEQGHIDILFNNAGLGLYGAVEETDLQKARYLFNVNFFAAAELSQLVIPYMRSAGKGRIIFTSSIAGKIYLPLGAWYHATKHAIEGWADCLRSEVSRFGIDVVIVEPGVIVTDFWKTVEENIIKVNQNSPYALMIQKFLAREKLAHSAKYGTPAQNIAKTVLKACTAKSPKIRYRTGRLAHISVFARNMFGDRIYDKIISYLY